MDFFKILTTFCPIRIFFKKQKISNLDIIVLAYFKDAPPYI